MRVFRGENAMKNVSLTEAKANIDELFEAVEQGQSVTIVPDQLTSAGTSIEADRLEVSSRAMHELRELRKKSGKVTREEILAWRDEGRRQ
jgi:hypothetical protein